MAKKSINPVAVLFLFACPALAGTTTVKCALGMSLAVAFVMILSSLVISLIKKSFTGDEKVVLILIVTAFFSATAQMLMASFLPKVYSMVSVYVAVCALQAVVYSVDKTIKDIFTDVVLFAVSAVVMAAIRQLLGSYVSILTKTSGAFIVYSIVLAAVAACTKKEAR